MRSPALALTSALLMTTTLGACSITHGSSSAATTPTSVTINDTVVKIPSGYTYAGTTKDSATSTTTTLMDAHGMPRYVTVAKTAANFDLKTWCSKMKDSFTASYAKGSKITSSVHADSCVIEGQGKTPGNGSTSSASATPSGYTAKTLPGGTEYANYATIKKASNGAYVAMLSRHLGANVSFKDDEAFFATVSK